MSHNPRSTPKILPRKRRIWVIILHEDLIQLLGPLNCKSCLSIYFKAFYVLKETKRTKLLTSVVYIGWYMNRTSTCIDRYVIKMSIIIKFHGEIHVFIVLQWWRQINLYHNVCAVYVWIFGTVVLIKGTVVNCVFSRFLGLVRYTLKIHHPF